MPPITETATPYADKLREAIEAQSRGGGRGTSEAERVRAQARRVATKVGRGMLAASDIETAQHSDDVVVISAGICDLLGIDGVDRDDLLAAARLHDIGKAAIPKRLLEKDGPLTDEEWEVMRTHTVVGEEILAPVIELRSIATLVRHSHERWDGMGYPDGLSGEAIPLGSRVIFCADAFHAIRSDRPYRDGRSAVEALAEISKHAGTQFDPRVVEALLEVARELRLAPVTGARVRRSSRLMALLLVLAIGGGSSALARTGLLGDPTTSAAGLDPEVPALQCDALGCVGFADIAKSAVARATAPDGAAGSQAAARGDDGASEGAGDGSGGAATPGDAADSSDTDSAGDSQQGDGSPGNSGSNPHGGPPGQSGDSTPGNSGNNPHGGPPGLNGGGNGGGFSGAPGNSGSNSHGSPPGQSGGTPPGQSGTSSPGNSGGNPHGGPPGQS